MIPRQRISSPQSPSPPISQFFFFFNFPLPLHVSKSSINHLTKWPLGSRHGNWTNSRADRNSDREKAEAIANNHTQSGLGQGYVVIIRNIHTKYGSCSDSVDSQSGNRGEREVRVWSSQCRPTSRAHIHLMLDVWFLLIRAASYPEPAQFTTPVGDSPAFSRRHVCHG
jgi:hypothetical protein